MKRNTRLLLTLGLMFFGTMQLASVSVGESFFLSRIGNSKLTFSGYYTSITTKADYKAAGAKIPFEFKHKEAILQSSYRLGPKTNLFGKFGISKVSREHINSGTKQWGNFGDSSVYGLGLDRRLGKESRTFPAMNLSLGMTRYHSALGETIFYGIDGEKRLKTKTRIILNDWQLSITASKTFGRLSVSAGVQESITTGEDVEEKFVIVAGQNTMWTLEDVRTGKGMFYIPESVFYAEREKIYANGYMGIGFARASFLEARNLTVSSKLEISSQSSMVLEASFGKGMTLSCGLTLGF